MSIRQMSVVAGLLLSLTRVAPAADPVLEWNVAVLNAARQDSTSPVLVARNLAMLHLSIAHAFKGKAGEDPALAQLADEAACPIALALYPSHAAEFHAVCERHSGGKLISVQFKGDDQTDFATRILTWRQTDGASTNVTYVPRVGVGEWKRTPPAYRPPELPQWGKVTPFLIERADQFRPSGPPDLKSVRFADAVNELKRMGGKDSAIRTDEQTQIARFWSDFSYTEMPPGHWDSIARTISEDRKLSPIQTAELFALLNVAMADAGIAMWDAKYHFNFWRPVTAIPRAGEAENSLVEAEPAWRPLLNTPPHPEYVSGHSGFSAAGATILTHFLGTDAISFTARSDTLPKLERRFDNLKAAAEECGMSRIYGGIHYRFSCDDGLAMGKQIADYVWQRRDRILKIER